MKEHFGSSKRNLWIVHTRCILNGQFTPSVVIIKQAIL